MSYLVLARKYRPQAFTDLVGQEHVTQTLANAIAQDRVAHAFLFTGVRGVGKTTSARILAKCLNCLGPAGEPRTGPTATPCQTCAACTEIANGSDMDVQEIDAASYNGVDEVRRLQEGLAFRPARDRFKIYIVDEVHMLSNAAWNAFLKTLEEPPPHVKFIFATTEVHKVPVTILSRCQRYDFKLVPARTIATRLREVLGKEGIKAEDTAVSILAREAAGSMRDAMSLLDQVIAFRHESIAADDVARVLGVADRQVLFDLSSAVLAGDAAKALSVLDAVARQGFDLAHLCRDLLHHVRNVVVAKVMTEAEARALLDLADEEVADVLALAQKSDQDDLTRLFTGFSKSYDEIVKSGEVRAALEMTLVRLARRPPLLPLDELLARLGELEKRLATGAPPPARGGGGGGGKARGEPATPSITSTPRGDATDFAGPMPTSIADVTRAVVESAPRATALPAVAPVTAPKPPASAPRVIARANEEMSTNGALALAEPAPEPAPPPVEPTPQPASAVQTASEAAPRESDAITTWRALLERVRKTSPAIAATLELAAPLTVNRDALVLAFERESFEDGRAGEQDAHAVLLAEAQAHFGAATKVTFQVAARGTSKGASVAYLDKAKKKQAMIDARLAIENHELVRAAKTIFDAELRDVRLPAQED